MLNVSRARHARSLHRPRHARPSQLPARVAVATACGGVLLPVIATSSAASAGVRQTSATRVSGPAAAVPPGQAPVSVRLLSDGHYVRNGVVEVQIREGDGWRSVAKADTDSSGLGHTSIPVNSDTRIRAYYRGSAVRTAAASSSAIITVAQPWGKRVLTEAARHEGAPYEYGAAGPNAFDCSGFTMYVFGQLGRSLPHNADEQEQATQPVPASQMQPGDLIFFHDSGSVSHVGIYAGDGQMWDAPHSGDAVRRRAIYSSDYSVGRA